MKCQNCHGTVTKKSNFCPSCGEKIVLRKSSRNAVKPKNIPAANAILLIAVGVAIGFLIFKAAEDSGRQTRTTPVNYGNAFNVGPVAVNQIVTGLRCICGTCEHLLNECECEHPEGAKEVKTFIGQQLQAGHKKPHILEMLFARYPKFKS